MSFHLSQLWLEVVLFLKVTRVGRANGETLHDRTASWRTAFANTYESSKPVERHFNPPNHSHHNMTICGLSLHHGNTENRKNLEQKFIFQLGTLSDLHTELMNASYSQIHVTIFPPMAKLLYTLI